MGKCKTWTLDSGLDYGLDSGLDFGLNCSSSKFVPVTILCDRNGKKNLQKGMEQSILLMHILGALTFLSNVGTLITSIDKVVIKTIKS